MSVTRPLTSFQTWEMPVSKTKKPTAILAVGYATGSAQPLGVQYSRLGLSAPAMYYPSAGVIVLWYYGKIILAEGAPPVNKMGPILR